MQPEDFGCDNDMPLVFPPRRSGFPDAALDSDVVDRRRRNGGSLDILFGAGHGFHRQTGGREFVPIATILGDLP